MDEFRRSFKERRDAVLAELRHKMTNLRSQNVALKKILEENNLSHPFAEDFGQESSDSAEESSDSPSVHQVDYESEILRLKRELSETQHELQEANGEMLTLKSDLIKTQTHCQTLKEVNKITKELVQIREQESVQLKAKLKEIETTMGERETELMSQNLRDEYTRQIENIKKLRTLYEQRARSADAEIESLKRKLADRNKDIDHELLKNEEKQRVIAQLEEEVRQLKGDLNTVTENFKDNCNEMDLLKNDLHTINKLFSKILLNKKNDEIRDLERLKVVLEENRQLLREVTKRSNKCSIITDSVLPKLLCDLIIEAFPDNDLQSDDASTEEEFTNDSSDLLSTEDILENLPKIWRILTELIIHQKKIDPIAIQENSQSEDCYNSIETPTGPQMVLSVSKTFIKLKNLILEKKSLQKDTKRMKILNTHLQQTLYNQENRLGVVSLELTKTWHLVNRMKREHRKLHTHEQVLRYQLQQKRRMLSMLKEDLESCRHKWTRAREKNEDSEQQWKSLREEFSSRKDTSTSVESGYSDEQVTDDDGDVEDNSEEDVPKIPLNETLEEMFLRLNAIHNKPEDKVEEPLDIPFTSGPLNPISEEPSPVGTSGTSDQAVKVEPTPEEAEQSTEKDKPVQPVLAPDLQPEPGPSSSSSPSSCLTQTEEEYTTRRAERIKRLELQCQELFNKVTSNKRKGDELSQQLDTIQTRHEDRNPSSDRDPNAAEADAVPTETEAENPTVDQPPEPNNDTS